METQSRETLLDVAGLLNPATMRIERLTRAIRKEPVDRLEAAGIPGDIRMLREEYTTLEDVLRCSCIRLRDQWPDIQNNRGRLFELQCFESSFSRFCSAIHDFDDAVTADEPAADNILQEYQASREYAILASKYAILLYPAFEYEHSLRAIPQQKQTPLQGLCADMAAFFQGKTDAELEDALLQGTYGGPRGLWKGTLTQATYFGRHFHVSAQVMNKLFNFYGEDSQPRKAHYTKYPAARIHESDPLAIILSKYPRKG